MLKILFDFFTYYYLYRTNNIHTMSYQLNTIYHCFNQGNNRQKIFFKKENYLFFMKKMRTHLLPVADILAYCLMPNHFHWLFQLKEEGFQETRIKNPTIHRSVNIYQQQISQSIAILLRSYTRAINKQEDRTGSLFRHKTKLKDGKQDLSEFITIEGKHKELFFQDSLMYARRCFKYIHENPVASKLTLKTTDWEFSSAMDYAGLRDESICNKELAKELILF